MSLLAEPQVHLWTRSEYARMAEIGLFTGKHVELIEGRVIEMSPMGSLHATGVALAAKAVERAFGANYFVRWQMPFAVGALSEPEPDVAVVAGDVRAYVHAHPTTAALIVEVAETSLEYDRTVKASLYAKAGVADYWILNLSDAQIEVFRMPTPDPEQEYGFGYAMKTVFTAAERVTPLALPQVAITVADMLP
jgi:Uma2 family endonuclease